MKIKYERDMEIKSHLMGCRNAKTYVEISEEWKKLDVTRRRYRESKDNAEKINQQIMCSNKDEKQDGRGTMRQKPTTMRYGERERSQEGEEKLRVCVNKIWRS